MKLLFLLFDRKRYCADTVPVCSSVRFNATVLGEETFQKFEKQVLRTLTAPNNSFEDEVDVDPN